MHKKLSEEISPAELVESVSRHYRLWVWPTIICTVLATIYALIMPRKWEASQSMLLRQQAAGTSDARVGKFSDMSEMKLLQETVLEIARSRNVLKATLEDVGPPPSLFERKNWPSDQDIEDLRSTVRMSPPKGAEFGKTEVFYLSVRSRDRQRALALVDTLCSRLSERLNEIRNDRAKSMIEELQKTEELAANELEASSRKLTQFETNVGVDLTELRILDSSSSGTSDLRLKLIAMEDAKRKYETTVRQNEQLLKLLVAAQKDPLSLVATPNSLLASQPALRRLKDGLVDTQLRTSRLLGTRREIHPQVIAARQSEAEVSANLREELASAIRGVQVDLIISRERLATITTNIEDARGRLEALAGKRAEYSNLVAAVKDRTSLLETARKNLADAKAAQASAKAASLLVRIDTPDAGVRPAGLGRKTVVGAGLLGGLVIGGGLLFLFAFPTPMTGPKVSLDLDVESMPTSEGVLAHSTELANRAPQPSPFHESGNVVDPHPSRETTRPPSKRQRATSGPSLEQSEFTSSQQFGMKRSASLRQALENVLRQDRNDNVS